MVSDKKEQCNNCDHEEQGAKCCLFILDKCKYELEQISQMGSALANTLDILSVSGLANLNEKKKHGYIFFIFEVIPPRRFLLTLRCFQVRNNVPHPVFLVFSSGLCWLLWIIHFLPLLYYTLEAMPPLEFSSPFTLLFKVAGDECWSTLVCCFVDIIPLKLKCLIIIFCHWKWHLQNMIHLLALSMMSLLMERNNVYLF